MNLIKNSVIFLFGLIFGLIVLYLILFFDELNLVFNNHQGWITIISIVIAIFVFLFTWLWDKYKITLSNRNLLKSLKNLVNLLKEDCKGYRTEIIKCSLPLYKIKKINFLFYAEIKSGKIKVLISKINDKVDLINDYLTYIISEWNNFIKNVKYNDNCDMQKKIAEEWSKFVKNNFFYVYYKKKIEGTIIDLEQYLNELNEKISEEN